MYATGMPTFAKSDAEFKRVPIYVEASNVEETPFSVTCDLMKKHSAIVIYDSRKLSIL